MNPISLVVHAARGATAQYIRVTVSQCTAGAWTRHTIRLATSAVTETLSNLVPLNLILRVVRILVGTDSRHLLLLNVAQCST